MNWDKIQEDVKALNDDIGAQNYEKSGEDVADILVKSVGPVGELLKSLY